MNKHTLTSKRLVGVAIVSFGFVLSGCGSDSDDDMGTTVESMPAQYSVTVTNLTASQPLSPIAVVMHSSDWQSFMTGEPASLELEHLAESGDNSSYLTAAEGSDLVYSSIGGSGIVGPGASETLTLEVDEDFVGTVSLSMMTMLVNTNDALAALNSKSIANMSVGDSMSFNTLSYDSGTEANTETADTMPGPAAEGGLQEGFNAVRDDIRDAVFVHTGVVTSDDGLVNSALTNVHRWDHPAVKVTVVRTR